MTDCGSWMFRILMILYRSRAVSATAECFQVFNCVITMRVTIVCVNLFSFGVAFFLYNTCGIADGVIYIYPIHRVLVI